MTRTTMTAMTSDGVRVRACGIMISCLCVCVFLALVKAAAFWRAVRDMHEALA